MERNHWIKLVGFFTVLGAIAAVFVVPEFRKFVGLELPTHPNGAAQEQTNYASPSPPLRAATPSKVIEKQSSVQEPTPEPQAPIPEPTKIPSVKPTWPEKAIQAVQVSGLTFELRQARMLGGNVTFYLMIISHEENRAISFSTDRNNSVLWDNLGNRYIAARNTIANDINSYYPIRIIPELPTKATITFDNVSSEASDVASLKIVFWTTWRSGTEGDWIGVEFRNVPLTN